MELKKRVAYRYNIVLLAIVLFVVYVVYQTVTIAVNKKARLKFVRDVPAEYKNLFVQNDANISDVSSYILYHTDFSPISHFHYNSQQWVVVTKFKTSEKLDSIPNVNVKYGGTELTEGNVYAGFDGGYFHMDVLPESNMIKTINLDVDGVTKGNVRENKNF